MISASLAAGVLLFVASACEPRPCWRRSPGASAARGSTPSCSAWPSRRCRSACGRPAAPTSASGAATRLFVTGLAVGFLPIAAQVFAEATSPALRRLHRRAAAAAAGRPGALPAAAVDPGDHRLRGAGAPRHGREGCWSGGRCSTRWPASRSSGWRRRRRRCSVVTLVRNRDQTIGELVTTASALSTSVPLGGAAARARRAPVAARAHRPHVLPRGRRHPHAHRRAGVVHRGSRRHPRGRVPLVQRPDLRDTLHLAQADVLVVDPGRRAADLARPGGCGRCRSTRRWPSGLLARPDPMTVELDQLDGWVQRLPLDDQQWLADGDVHVLVPLRAGPGSGGVMALGEKLNDLPFSRDDRALLAPVAAALALKIENLRLRAGAERRARTPRTRRTGRRRAGGRVRALRLGRHRRRRRPLRAMRRRGRAVAAAGGARRQVPARARAGPRRDGRRLPGVRHRARAAGGHQDAAAGRRWPNRSGCAARPGRWPASRTRTWRWSSASRPGADRRRWSWSTWTAARWPIGCAGRGCRRARSSRMAHDLAGAIAHIHDDGLLHRDIKPSNIAFTRDGQPKLLDFGLAQIFVAARPVESRARSTGGARPLAGRRRRDHRRPPRPVRRHARLHGAGGRRRRGARRRRRPVELRRGAVRVPHRRRGHSPNGRSTRPGVDWVREIHAVAPDCPSPLAELVADLLATDRRQRPPSAHVVRKRLLDQATLRVA